ncbi:hypothetical protein DYI95_002010 [Thermaerobacter sp. PB12/4term]|uniref:hypothetical protein n=1 Tax=Thermaerobacter sp. PB12/4term TaxID=2293838 RepID=UPI000E325264|nr:hypothetical protein [Thermaerobacter sp. PB12/4term]QIA26472.1 hypothetical protein DYI95_002010 [Thermaerobacter sp. PB12/4term]
MIGLEGIWEVTWVGRAGPPVRVWVPQEPPCPPGHVPPRAVVYRRDVEVPPGLLGGKDVRAYLELAMVLGRARVQVNGDAYDVPGAGQVTASLDVTRSLRPGTNRLAVEVAGPEDGDGGRRWSRGRSRWPVQPAGARADAAPRDVQAVAWGAWARPEAVPPGFLPPGLAGPVRLRFVRGVVPVAVSWFFRDEEEGAGSGSGAAGRGGGRAGGRPLPGQAEPWERPEPAGPLPLCVPWRPGVGEKTPDPPAGPDRTVVYGCARVRYLATEPVRGRCWIEIEPDGFDAPGARAAWDVEAQPPGGTWEVWFALPSPRLWTVGDWGRPDLYRLRAGFEPAGGPAQAPVVPAGSGEPGSPAAAWGPAPAVEVLAGVRFIRRLEGAWYLNWQPLRFRGACLLPLASWPGAVSPRQARAWVRRARALGLNALRVYAHMAHPALYEAASRLGVVLWQDLPPVGCHTPEAAAALGEQLAAWVEEAGRWPAVVAWSICPEPALPLAGERPRGPGIRTPAGIRIPRLQATGSRVAAGLARQLAALDPGRPVLERAGAPSWTRIGGAMRFLPAGDVPDPGALERRWRLAPHVTVIASLGWPAGDQTAQARFVRYSGDALRRRPYPASGGFFFALNDPPGGPAYGLYTAEGRPREAARACREVLAPVRLLVGAWPRRCRPGRGFRLPVWLVNDTARPLTGRWTWQLVAGRQVLAAGTMACGAAARSLVPVGWITGRWPQEAVPSPSAGPAAGAGRDEPGPPARALPLVLYLDLQVGGRLVRSAYPLPAWLPGPAGAGAAAAGGAGDPGGTPERLRSS